MSETEPGIFPGSVCLFLQLGREYSEILLRANGVTQCACCLNIYCLRALSGKEAQKINVLSEMKRFEMKKWQVCLDKSIKK